MTDKNTQKDSDPFNLDGDLSEILLPALMMTFMNKGVFNKKNQNEVDKEKEEADKKIADLKILIEELSDLKEKIKEDGKDRNCDEKIKNFSNKIQEIDIEQAVTKCQGRLNEYKLYVKKIHKFAERIERRTKNISRRLNHTIEKSRKLQKRKCKK